MSESNSNPDRTKIALPRRGKPIGVDPDATVDHVRSSRGSTIVGKGTPARAEGAIPERIGRFEIRSQLGEGAFGRVYRAFDPELRREVAIKVPHAKGMTAEYRERFLLEARAAATIHHPNVCPVYEVGGEGDTPFLVMHFVAGPTLSAVLSRRKEPFPARHAAAIVRKLALGVAAAHAKGVIHRDLKPQNVLVDDASREVLITDFGLARIGGQDRLTAEGDIFGTPAYMSPEQARGEIDRVGPASDIYALGVVLYQMVAGRLPYRGSILEVLCQIQQGDAKPPSAHRAGVHVSLDAICMKSMAPRIEDRHASAKHLADALGDFISASKALDPGTDDESTKSIVFKSVSVARNWESQGANSAESSTVLPLPIPETEPRRGAGRRAWIAGGVALLAIGVAIAFAALPGQDRDSESARAVEAGAGKPTPAEVPPRAEPPRSQATEQPAPAPAPKKPAPVAEPVPQMPEATPPKSKSKPRILPLNEVLIKAGDVAVVPFEVDRDGFEGPLTISVSGLPAEVTVPNEFFTLPADATKGAIKLTASRKAPDRVATRAAVLCSAANGETVETPLTVSSQKLPARELVFDEAFENANPKVTVIGKKLVVQKGAIPLYSPERDVKSGVSFGSFPAGDYECEVQVKMLFRLTKQAKPRFWIDLTINNAFDRAQGWKSIEMVSNYFPNGTSSGTWEMKPPPRTPVNKLIWANPAPLFNPMELNTFSFSLQGDTLQWKINGKVAKEQNLPMNGRKEDAAGIKYVFGVILEDTDSYGSVVELHHAKIWRLNGKP